MLPHDSCFVTWSSVGPVQYMGDRHSYTGGLGRSEQPAFLPLGVSMYWILVVVCGAVSA